MFMSKTDRMRRHDSSGRVPTRTIISRNLSGAARRRKMRMSNRARRWSKQFYCARRKGDILLSSVRVPEGWALMIQGFGLRETVVAAAPDVAKVTV